MNISRRKFTARDKLRVLVEAGATSTEEILLRYCLKYGVYTRWKRQLSDLVMQVEGEDNESGLQQYLQDLRMENKVLKQVLTENLVYLGQKEAELKELRAMLK